MIIMVIEMIMKMIMLMVMMMVMVVEMMTMVIMVMVMMVMMIIVIIMMINGFRFDDEYLNRSLIIQHSLINVTYVRFCRSKIVVCHRNI